MASQIASKLKRPTTQPEVAAGIDRARDLAVQSIAASTPTGIAAGAPVAQQAAVQAGVQAATGRAESALGQAAAMGQQADLARTGLASQQQAVQGANQTNTMKLAADNERALGALSQSVKQQVFDDRVKFESDQIGQGRLQDSQLADWAVTKAKNAEELKNYAQALDISTQKELTFLEQGWKRLEQTLRLESEGKIQKLDQETRLRITRAVADAKQAYQKRAAKAAANRAIITGAGAVVGGVVGGMAGGPGGAVVGSQMGQGAGEMAAGSMA